MPIQIPLYRRNGSIAGHTLVDIEDDALARAWRWHLNGGYAKRWDAPSNRILLLHREILGLTRGDPHEADHISGDRLDNRRQNLRIVTRAQNAQNLPGSRRDHRSSRFRGVEFDPISMGTLRTKPWRVRVRIEGKQRTLGRYATEGEAAAVARAARLRCMTHTVEART